MSEMHLNLSVLVQSCIPDSRKQDILLSRYGESCRESSGIFVSSLGILWNFRESLGTFYDITACSQKQVPHQFRSTGIQHIIYRFFGSESLFLSLHVVDQDPCSLACMYSILSTVLSSVLCRKSVVCIVFHILQSVFPLQGMRPVNAIAGPQLRLRREIDAEVSHLKTLDGSRRQSRTQTHL
jgi:hypothetical protein